MSEKPSILRAEGVCKSYRMGTGRVSVLKGVNLGVRAGEFVALVGASGSGKSTLLHILGGLDRPDAGHVSFEGEEISGFSARQINRFRNRTVGFVFQFYHLLDELNVLENVLLPTLIGRSVLGWLGCRGRARARALEVMDQMGLAARAQHKPWQLSGGERQRVAIGRALMNNPRLLLADEPTGNLDSVTGNGILEVFEALNRAGQTVVLVTHDERVARRAGRVVTLADGLVARGN
jgi:lipoprotein-releasing system ATP-binding protein